MNAYMHACRHSRSLTNQSAKRHKTFAVSCAHLNKHPGTLILKKFQKFSRKFLEIPELPDKKIDTKGTVTEGGQGAL